MKPTSSESTIILNRGQRAYRTSAGVLAPGASVELPAKEAKSLLDHSDLVDAEKAAPQIGGAMEKLRKENEHLKKALASKPSAAEGDVDVVALRTELEKVQQAHEVLAGECEVLTDANRRLQDENEDLREKLEKAQKQIEKLKDK